MLNNDVIEVSIGRCRIEADWICFGCESSCVGHREFPTASLVQARIFLDSIKTTVLALCIGIARRLKLSLADVFPLATLEERVECCFTLVLGQNAVVITRAITTRGH